MCYLQMQVARVDHRAMLSINGFIDTPPIHLVCDSKKPSEKYQMKNIYPL